MNDFQDGEITERIIGASFEMHSVLGCGFLEKGYENALLAELCERRVKAETQKAIRVKYKDALVGDYFAD